MKKVLLLSTLVTASLISCGKDDDKVEITVPATYEFTRDGVSTVSYSGQTARIDMATELVGALKSTASTEVQLLEMYRNQKADGSDANPYNGTALNTSTKSVKSKVAASKDFFSANTVAAASVKQDFEGWIAAFVSEKEAYDNNLAEAGQPGQIADGSSTRLVNGGGLEYIQAVNKGLIGALMVDQLCNNYLSPAVLDEGENVSQNDTGIVANGKPYTTMEHKWDEAYGYLFGKAADGASPLAKWRD